MASQFNGKYRYGQVPVFSISSILLSNLKYFFYLLNQQVIEVCRPDTRDEEEALLRCIASKTNIVGFFWYPKYNRSQGAAHIPEVQLTNIDMVAIFEEPFALTHTTLFYCCHQSLSQLYISNENWSPAIILPRFWNLRRLHMLYHDR